MASVWRRDFVGYGSNPPKVKWPDGKKLAVNVVVNYEGAGERNVLFGDKGPEVFGGEIPGYGGIDRDLSMETVFEYETRVAIWRLLDLLKRHNVNATFFAVAKSLEANPDAARRIVKEGHEICSHGYRWIEHFKLSRREEAAEIQNAVALIKKVTGVRPVGWYCREPSVNTVALVAKEGGFIYDADFCNDDIPYYVKVSRGDFLIVPYTLDINDFHFLLNRFSTSEEFFQYTKDSFDYLHRESQKNGKMMTVATHVRITGRPGSAGALDRFIDYAKKFDDVWFARRDEIAKWWLANYPPKQ